MTEVYKYNLEKYNQILFDGFEYVLPDKTVEINNNLTNKMNE